MKIAIPYDFDKTTDIRREGIGVYVKHLVNALLTYTKDAEIEIWTYKYNKNNVKLLFADAFNKYPDRISIHCMTMSLSNTFRCFMLKKIIVMKYNYKKVKYLIKKIFNNDRYSKKIRKLRSYKRNELYKLSSYILQNEAKRAKSDVVYAFFVTQKLGKYFNCPKFVQVHDLFTFELFDLFAKSWNEDSLKLHNSLVLKNLTEYAKKNAIFISSSEYTVREHSLKFIPGITKKQTAVIPFPPLVKDFSDIEVLSKEEFKKKFGIWDKYVAVPSQNRPNKNWSVIFKAIARLKHKGINIQFVTTGTVKTIKDDALLAEDLNIQENILEIGSISEKDLYMLYKYEDIAVGSTIIEGMGISGQVIEALKVGNIPAVHSKCHGYIDSLKAVGLTEKTADLNWFDIDDDETLANYMEDILKNPQPHVEKQKHIIDAYMSITWKDVAQKYMELFKCTLNKQNVNKELMYGD